MKYCVNHFSDSDASANAVLSIIQLLSNADLNIKLAASRKVSSILVIAIKQAGQNDPICIDYHLENSLF